MIKPIHLFIFTLSLTSLSYAWLCPNNFKSVQAGDSMETVMQMCGKPASEKTLPAEKKQIPEQWDYIIQNSDLGPRFKQNNKLSLLFDANGKLINMTLNGTSIDRSSSCSSNIRIGTTKEDVKRSCGAPSFVLQSQATNPSESAETSQSDSVTWIYENNSGKTTFIFKDKILTDRQ